MRGHEMSCKISQQIFIILKDFHFISTRHKMKTKKNNEKHSDKTFIFIFIS